MTFKSWLLKGMESCIHYGLALQLLSLIYSDDLYFECLTTATMDIKKGDTIRVKMSVVEGVAVVEVALHDPFTTPKTVRPRPSAIVGRLKPSRPGETPTLPRPPFPRKLFPREVRTPTASPTPERKHVTPPPTPTEGEICMKPVYYRSTVIYYTCACAEYPFTQEEKMEDT